MEHELEQAGLLQQELFTQPRVHPNFEIVTHYHPSQQTGGDWLVARLNEENNVTRLLIGDVTGHGFAASLMTGAIHGAYMASECTSLYANNSEPYIFLISESDWHQNVAKTINSVVLDVGKLNRS